MEDLQDTVAQFLKCDKSVMVINAHNRAVRRTCSDDVLTNTGGPFKQLMKMGMSFFRKTG